MILMIKYVKLDKLVDGGEGDVDVVGDGCWFHEHKQTN